MRDAGHDRRGLGEGARRIAAARKVAGPREESAAIATSRGPGLGTVIPRPPSSPGKAARTFARRPGRRPLEAAEAVTGGLVNMKT